MSAHRWQGRAAATAAGLVVAWLLPEPPDRFHPVAWFGRAMATIERWLYRDDRSAGVAHAALGTGIGAASGLALTALTGSAASTAVATTVTVGGRMLTDVATGIGAAVTAGDVASARARLPALVGRDPSELSEAEIARAVVESVAENTVDAVVAPAAWALLAGAPGALAYRAVNTVDAMVGHHSSRYEHYGWAAARLDDLVNWLPARVAAALVALVRPRRAGAVWHAVRMDAPQHPSPNAGVVEAAFAAALGLRLGGTNRYGGRVEERALLGRGRRPEPSDIERAVRLSHHVTAAMLAGLAIAIVAPSVVNVLKGRERSGGSLAPWPATSSTRSG